MVKPGKSGKERIEELRKLQRELSEEDRKEIETFLAEFAGNLEKGLCPHCKQPMTQKQVRRCVYAMPCGHRLFQGRAS